MPFLSHAAQAALDAARDDLERSARATITRVLGEGAAADALVVEEIDLAGRLVVLSDGVTCLAVTATDEVFLVRDSEGWTLLAPVTSLAELGRALERLAAEGED